MGGVTFAALASPVHVKCWGLPRSGGRGSCRAARARKRCPWLSAQQELRPPGGPGSTLNPSVDGALDRPLIFAVDQPDAQQ